MVWLAAMVLAVAVSLGNHGYAQETQGPIIRAFHVLSDIKYHYAITRVFCRVVNPSAQSDEAFFIVTLPDSAFISDFVMEENGKVYKGHMKRKRKYDRAVKAGQSAGRVALDARDSNQFMISVNIAAQGKATFNLTYEQLLTRKLGVYTNTISVSPKQIVDEMSVRVHIDEPSAISHLEVSELQVPGTSGSGNRSRVAFGKIQDISAWEKEVSWAPTPDQQRGQGTEGFRGQLVVKYEIDRESTPLQTFSDQEYFINFFAPDTLTQLNKYIVFILDYSGSMLPKKTEQLKDAMIQIISELQPTDYFSIVIFNSDVKVWSPKDGVFMADELNSKVNQGEVGYIVESSFENIANAQQFLRDFSDSGGTNIIRGLRTGLELMNIGSDYWVRNGTIPPVPIIVFLTDGQPTDEETDHDVIVSKVTAENHHRSSIHALGFGYDAEMEFLRKLARFNNGTAQAIYEASDAASQLRDFYKSIGSPLVTDINFNFSPERVDSSTNTITRFPMFTKGSEIVVCGKIRKGKVKRSDKLGEVNGISARGVINYPIIYNPKGNRIRRSIESEPESYFEKAWAHVTIHQLLDEADTLDGDEKNQTLDKASELSLKYSLATPVTSVVVAKPDEQEEVVVDTVPVKAGDWSYSDGVGIDLVVNQPSISVNYTQPQPNSGRTSAPPGLNLECTIILSLFVYVIKTVLLFE
ncbi:inter-alpha-trypsin inhibitor heavy chain H4-like [Homalodisca vitripennis]|uniref:inter-alpha-trypsin inhibitor heavy chain H4-like n=1 Tax=Homalodisca vitripennis TaxID=197043 RepID=UPI001EEB11C9|nr:inter-alpha-trypsin inhibitor heavy chain H4-like [Homalodisca vitripennis]